MPGFTAYTTRQPLPHLIELGRATTLTAPVYLSGTLTAPASGTVSIYDETDTAVASAQAVTVTSSTATYTVAGATTSSRSPSSGWRVEWTLTMTDGEVVPIRDEAYLVRYRLRPVISDVDIGQRIRSLDTSLAGRSTTVTTYQAAITEADIVLQSDLIALGRRPWLVVSASALRECWLALTIAIILDGLAVSSGANGDSYAVRAADWRERYDVAFARARLAIDWEDDGQADEGVREGPRAGGVWLC